MMSQAGSDRSKSILRQTLGQLSNKNSVSIDRNFGLVIIRGKVGAVIEDKFEMVAHARMLLNNR